MNNFNQGFNQQGFNQQGASGSPSQIPNPYQVPGPGQQFQAPVHTPAKKGRGRLLAGLAAVLLAAGTGYVGYTIAGGMLGTDGDPIASASPGDQPGDGTGAVDPETGAPLDPLTGQNPVDGQTPVPGAAMTVEQANASVVRIEATGEFANPEFGLVEGVGSGSGFIINNEGVAVTNNHVVAGAAFLEVYLPGEDRPRNARILATSECSDLAVIDIDGSGFPQVSLNMAPPAIGTAVYAAGYPLGDPEFTLTKGIVSKAETRSDTPFSSVDGVLEHDARINPGNSGGPLFDQSGQVVGVNYQGNPETRQSFAITSANALPIIDQLTAGVSVDSIGINGQIVDLGDRFGLFVSSVETGSIADRAGIASGDVILELENVSVSTDGTMGDYCDVLRTNGTDVPLNITVLRPATDQVLFGTLNGDGLDVGFDGGEMMSQAGMSQPEQPETPTSPAGSYQRVTDDTGSIAVDVPSSWTDLTTSPIGEDQDIANLRSSSNLPVYDRWEIGGLQFNALDPNLYDYDAVWDAQASVTSECNEVEPIQDANFGEYTGLLQIAHGCGPSGQASIVVFQVQSPNSRNIGSGIIQVLTAEDVEAAERALATMAFS